jgi:hypothetical protein
MAGARTQGLLAFPGRTKAGGVALVHRKRDRKSDHALKIENLPMSFPRSDSSSWRESKPSYDLIQSTACSTVTLILDIWSVPHAKIRDSFFIRVFNGCQELYVTPQTRSDLTPARDSSPNPAGEAPWNRCDTLRNTSCHASWLSSVRRCARVPEGPIRCRLGPARRDVHASQDYLRELPDVNDPVHRRIPFGLILTRLVSDFQIIAALQSTAHLPCRMP